MKVAKANARKTIKSGEDIIGTILNISDLLTQDVDSSPAQKLVGKRTRTLQPNVCLHPPENQCS